MSCCCFMGNPGTFQFLRFFTIFNGLSRRSLSLTPTTHLPRSENEMKMKTTTDQKKEINNYPHRLVFITAKIESISTVCQDFQGNLTATTQTYVHCPKSGRHSDSFNTYSFNDIN